ncbi:MAG: T9SS type A sorting domain-containing protein, partial [Bacteroidales bacterium]
YSHTFNTPGVYDYQCDPHAGLGMVGQVIVEAHSSELTINFSGMNPHIGQDIWLRVEDAASGDEIFRGSEVVEASFSMDVPGIVSGNDYIVEMYADHNENGRYDAPGDDHAWRLQLNDVDVDETVDFVHNTDFTDIEWKHAAMVRLTGMNPHVGQESYFALLETATGKVVDRKSEIVSESFSVTLEALESGVGYHIDFFADHNNNGYYDAPADDHAWRLEIANANGDEVLDFAHNTNFTDIDWKHRLRVRFDGMNPHIGQMLKLYVRDQSSGTTLDSVTVAAIEDAEFDIESHILEVGGSYHVDFYADLNENGTYDAPPTDHAWRLDVSNAMGDVDLDFTHNTEFTDIMETGTTSAAAAYAELSLKVYPNPVRSQLTVESESIIRKAEILSVSGAVLSSYSEINASQWSIFLDEFAVGVYLLRISSDNAPVTVVRIMKQ